MINCMYKKHPHLTRILLTLVINMILLLPMQRLMNLLPGTEVRPAACVPVIFGIFWGMDGAIGVLISNVFSDICSNGMYNFPLLLGAVTNFFTALIAHRLYYSIFIKHYHKDSYIWDVASLLKYILIVFITESYTASLISQILYLFANVPQKDTFWLLFENNYQFAIVLGVPALLLCPYIPLKAVTPNNVGIDKKGLFLIIPLLSCPVVLEIFSILASFKDTTMIFCIASLICLLCSYIIMNHFTSNKLADIDSGEILKDTVKVKIIIYLMLAVMIIAIADGLLFYYLSKDFTSDSLSAWMYTYKMSTLTLNLLLVTFIILLRIIEKNITNPLYYVASIMKKDTSSKNNEINILSESLDFIVIPDKDALSNDEYKIYIGLEKNNSDSKDSHEFSYTEAREIIGHICLKYVKGFTSTNAIGGWKDSDKDVIEHTLIYTIFGVSKAQIDSIAKEILTALNQQSILIEKNNSVRWYCSQ